MTERKRTKEEARKYVELLNTCMNLQIDMQHAHAKGLLIPKEWSEISAIPPVQVKERITMRLDKDVVKFYKALGPGYQKRMNAVLRVFMLSMLCKECEGAFDRDWKGDPI